MRFTYNQYNYHESGYRIPSKMHNNGAVAGSMAAAYQHHHKSNFGMRMTMSTASTMTSRIQRKGFRTPSKRHPGKVFPGKLHSVSRIGPGKLAPGKRLPQRPHPPPCDNSNDSGFGFDQHVELQQQQLQAQHQNTASGSGVNNSVTGSGNIDGSSSGSSNLSSTSSHYHSHHNHHHSHHHHNSGAVQHSSHLIRAIPASRSALNKKQPFKLTDDDEKDFCTDDSDDYYGHRARLNSSGSVNLSAPSLSTVTQQHFQDDGQSSPKVKKLESFVELDNDDACSEDVFIRKIANATNMDAIEVSPPPLAGTHAVPTKFVPTGQRATTRVAHKRQPSIPQNTIASSLDGRVQLEIISQPEQQHRARYQTEGSRGAVKDRSGNGFPMVRLNGYSKPAVLQVFIGTDIGRVAPHMFYQACKVAGKNSTQCNEKKVDGTMVIEIDFKPESDMTITCDCVGILKERNVDVEHRFPDHLAQKNKKKSTRCRMVFRTQLAHDDGTVEMLQVCSNPIICTQPPGVPEICKKSLNSCPVGGGLELFIIGKNFLKDTHVIFQETFDSTNTSDAASDIAVHQHINASLWEQTVLPDKEYLQQTHLICTVPPYIHQNILKPVTVQLSIISSGKKSESHSFIYTPKGTYSELAAATTLSSALHGSLPSGQDDSSFMDATNSLSTSVTEVRGGNLWSATETKHEIDSGMMPPPITTHMPMTGIRRPSLPTATPMMTDQQLAHLNVADTMKTELIDETSQNSIADSLQSSDAVGGCGTPHSPTALQYHTQYDRKNSMDAMLYESNSLPGFPVASRSVAAVVEMAVKSEIAKVVAQQQQQQQATVVVDQFITDLAKSTAVPEDAAVAAAVAVAERSLFGVGGVNTAVGGVIDNPFGDILQQAGSSQSTVLERSLSISSNSSSHSSNSNGSPPHTGLNASISVSPSNSMNGHNSPITQDIILNSEPAAALSAAGMPMQPLLPTQHLVQNTAVVASTIPDPVATVTADAVAATPANNGGLTTELIMNPAVSPSTILCSANGAATAVVPNIMAPHQVTMANSILNDIAMQPQPTQQDAAVAALALSNIIMSPTNSNGSVVNDVNAVQQANVQPAAVTAATSTAVSNLIIKAAADLISNQEQQTQQQQQLLNSNTAAAASGPLVNLLLNHSDVPPSTAAAVSVQEVQSQFPLGIAPATSPESLIVALATENAMETSVAAAAVTTNGAVVTQQTSATTTGLHTAAAVGSVPLQPPIPQELTTMSDQDLISYINPSTFDQI